MSASVLCAIPQQPVEAGCRLAARVLLRSSMLASFLYASVTATQPAEAGCQLAARAVERSFTSASVLYATPPQPAGASCQLAALAV